MKYMQTLKTPIGFVTLESTQTHLTHIHWGRKPEAGKRSGTPGILDETIRQLNEYFNGDRELFDIPVHIEGTAFQKRVWDALTKIPYGDTISYKSLARWIKNPKAVRAVGSANGRNPLSIIVPCHRVIAADGSLGGYGGGLKTKSFLLDLERHT